MNSRPAKACPARAAGSMQQAYHDDEACRHHLRVALVIGIGEQQQHQHNIMSR
jgi:hypothetical protein